MIHALTAWLPRKWLAQPAPELREAYRVTFSTLHGQQVLHHLLDTVYCQTYDGTDPNAALVFSAKRAVIQDILINIDTAEWPDKYQFKQEGVTYG